MQTPVDLMQALRRMLRAPPRIKEGIILILEELKKNDINKDIQGNYRETIQYYVKKLEALQNNTRARPEHMASADKVLDELADILAGAGIGSTKQTKEVDNASGAATAVSPQPATPLHVQQTTKDLLSRSHRTPTEAIAGIESLLKTVRKTKDNRAKRDLNEEVLNNVVVIYDAWKNTESNDEKQQFKQELEALSPVVDSIIVDDEITDTKFRNLNRDLKELISEANAALTAKHVSNKTDVTPLHEGTKPYSHTTPTTPLPPTLKPQQQLRFTPGEAIDNKSATGTTSPTHRHTQSNETKRRREGAEGPRAQKQVRTGVAQMTPESISSTDNAATGTETNMLPRAPVADVVMSDAIPSIDPMQADPVRPITGGGAQGIPDGSADPLSGPATEHMPNTAIEQDPPKKADTASISGAELRRQLQLKYDRPAIYRAALVSLAGIRSAAVRYYKGSSPFNPQAFSETILLPEEGLDIPSQKDMNFANVSGGNFVGNMMIKQREAPHIISLWKKVDSGVHEFCQGHLTADQLNKNIVALQKATIIERAKKGISGIPPYIQQLGLAAASLTGLKRFDTLI